MPFLDIDIDDILYACSRHDIKELIQALVNEGYLPNEILNNNKEVKQELIKRGRMEDEFSQKLEKLKSKYYNITPEEENFLESIFKKYI